ncbi:OsmC family protein [Stakelama sediminis]|uniref:Putative redox protein n=1 Tax=Stakelama sediminis TaxID=463200 RepID=A0A840YW92_9SPHN|nr:OsmC family protein [Stakelama sediminis]MBB5717814.1 putative redox protein [Stakelama sediminis]
METLEEPLAGEVIATALPGKFATLLRTAGHRWIGDEAVALGGQDDGPDPYAMLLGALGACTGMTIRLVAEREGMALDDVEVRLRHDRNHAKDCDHCLEEKTRVEAIFRTIRLTGDLNAAERARLMEVADRCPVHRTLTGTLHVHTTVEE